MGMRISDLTKAGMALLFGMMCGTTYAGGMSGTDTMKGHDRMPMETGKTHMMKEEAEMKAMEGDMKAMEAEMPEKIQDTMMEKEGDMGTKEGM
jgi:hypothetical protein